MPFEREEAILQGQYELIEVVAESGNSVVIRGRHRDIDQQVAIKRISAGDSSAQAARLLRAEAEILAVLSHPHILRVYSYRTDGEMHLLVVEWLERGTLRQYFARAERSVLDVCAAGIVTGSALQAAHLRGVVHRDIKPANLLVAADHTIKVADFGIAQIVDRDGRSGQNNRAATLAYAPAEQIHDGTSSPAVDVYALGVTLYELFSGRLPFPPPPRAASPVDPWAYFADQHATVIPPALDAIGATSSAVAAVIARAMHKDPDRRHQSGLELALDLAAAAVRTFGRDAFARCALPLYVDQELQDTIFGVGLGTWAVPATDLTADAAAAYRDLTAVPRPRGPRRRWSVVGGRGTAAPGEPVFSVLLDVPNTPAGSRSGRPRPAGAGGGGGNRADTVAARRRGPGPAPVPEPVRVLDAHGIALGPDGSVYLSQPARHQVLRLYPSGRVRRVLGTREAGYSGPAGSARMARIDTPYGLAFGPDGLLYVADSGNGLIRQVDPDRDIVRTAAGVGADIGGGSSSSSGAGGWWTLAGPRGVAFTDDGALLVADTEAHRVLRIEPGGGPGRDGSRVARGRVTVVAGTGAPGLTGDHGLAQRARLCRPSAVAVTPDGRILIADTDNDRLRAVAPDGRITTLAGAAYDPRGHRLSRPAAVAAGADGRIAVCAASPAGLLELRPTPGDGAGRQSPPVEVVPVDTGALALDAVASAVAGVAYLPRGALLSVRPGSGLIRVLEPDGRRGTLAADPWQPADAPHEQTTAHARLQARP